jgi:hypothetical protein
VKMRLGTREKMTGPSKSAGVARLGFPSIDRECQQSGRYCSVMVKGRRLGPCARPLKPVPKLRWRIGIWEETEAADVFRAAAGLRG